MGIPGIDFDEEATPETSPIKSFGGINDFFGMPPPLADIEESLVADEPVYYIRSIAISEVKVFRMKVEITLARGLMFLQEGF